RSRELEQAGYHAQVVANANSFPLFMHTDGARHALTRNEHGLYQVKGAVEEYDAEDLARLAESEPTRFSPNVTLRAVVQDYLLPTVAYLGGSAEIAYFAQTAEAYRVLNRPATPILPRASMTIIEHRTGRALERYGLRLEDFFAGPESVMARVAEEHLGTEAAHAFDHTEQAVARELDALKERLREVDPTLADALETGRHKINYQLHGLRTRFHRAQMKRDEATHRQLQRAAELLYPQKSLQERHINVTSLVARHGLYCINWIYDAINLGSPDHQIVYL
ncbi:MAG TPA: bacillithiol biosynthesis BshC, partial [Pyrinomonadaceae bacterium]